MKMYRKQLFWNSVIVGVIVFMIGCSSIITSKRHEASIMPHPYRHCYLINKDFNLNGMSILLSENDTLIFKGGIIRNGTIVGNNNVIVGNKKILFKNITIAGRWNNSKVYSEWFSFSENSRVDNRQNFANLMALCKGQSHTDVYIKKGKYWTTTRRESTAIPIPSNTSFHFSGTIYELPNDYERASLIRLYHVNNVVVDGGRYIGDLEEHKGKTGEWSHGISIWGSSNVEIKNVVCEDFWGDGIDLIEAFDNQEKPVYNCKNVIIDSCVCRYSRRQGLSIESGVNILVKNSEFSFSGTKKYTPPAAGIDIEAWANNKNKISNVRIVNCTMRNNVGYSFQSYANAVFGAEYNKYENCIVVDNCDMDNVLVYMTNGIEFSNSKISKGYVERKSRGVHFINCSKE